MSSELNRRTFIKQSIATSSGSLFALQAGAGGAGAAVDKSVKVGLPMGKIGDLQVSRLLLGGNLLTHFTHSRDLRYVYNLTAHYNTNEKIIETMKIAESHGIAVLVTNQVIASPGPLPVENAVGGNVVAHSSHFRVRVRMGAGGQASGLRIAALIDAADLPPGDAKFFITEAGVADDPKVDYPAEPCTAADAGAEAEVTSKKKRASKGKKAVAQIRSAKPISKEWHHVAVTYDPLKTQKLRLYVDGEVSKETPASERWGNPRGQGLTISGRGNQAFKGIIDEGKMYSRALTAEEITGDYEATD